MIAEGPLAVIIAMTLPIAMLFTLFAGLQRIPWRNAFEIGIGSAVVLGLAPFAGSPAGRSIDTSSFIVMGAIAGGIAVRGYERGKRKRDELIAAIVGPQ
jgi:hypothetical protein